MSTTQAGVYDPANNLPIMDAVTLRALIRQAAHRIDNGIQRSVFNMEETRKRMGEAITLLQAALGTWEQRCYASDHKDIKYAQYTLKRGEDFLKSPVYTPPSPTKPLSENELKVIQRTIIGRRTIRRFSKKDVPDELLDKVLEAATWAPSACSLQGFRFIVVRKQDKKQWPNQPWEAPVFIVAGLDERPYLLISGNELPYNPYLDLGAAMQNILLMAHALGLGTAVSSFAGDVARFRKELAVPEYIKLVAYIVLGWPADNPTTVPRMELEEFVRREKWQERQP